MVVVAVIGILMAIAVPIYTSNTEAAKIATDQANLRILNSITNQYWFNYPDEYNNHFDEEIDSGKDVVRMNALVDANLINEQIASVRPGVSFFWDSKKWTDGENTATTSGPYLLTSEDITFGTVHSTDGIIAYTYNGSATDIILPADNDEGRSIKRIKDGLFKEKGLTSVVLPEKLVWIDAYLFAENSLTEIEIPSSVKYIRDNAFRGNHIKTLSLPDSLETITLGAFGENPITKITIGSGVTIHGHDWRNNHVMGVHGEQFKALYDANKEAGTEAGTYTWNGTTWIKE